MNNFNVFFFEIYFDKGVKIKLIRFFSFKSSEERLASKALDTFKELSVNKETSSSCFEVKSSFISFKIVLILKKISTFD